SGRARAPGRVSAEYRSWTWLLLVIVVIVIPKIVTAKILVLEICAKNIVAIVVPRRQPKLADLVAHRAQAHAEQLGRPRPVAAGGFEGHGKKLALHFAERKAGLPFRAWRAGRWNLSVQTFSDQTLAMLEGFDANFAAARQSYSPP